MSFATAATPLTILTVCFRDAIRECTYGALLQGIDSEAAPGMVVVNLDGNLPAFDSGPTDGQAP